MLGRASGSSSILLAAAALTVSVACGGSSSTSPPPANEGEHAAQSGASAAGGGADGDDHRPATENVEIHNACTDAVPIYFGEQPNGTSGDFVTLRGDGTSHVPRREHGELTVWIVDDKGFGLAHVKVTRRMRRVEIGPSCRTLHAD